MGAPGYQTSLSDKTSKPALSSVQLLHQMVFQSLAWEENGNGSRVVRVLSSSIAAKCSLPVLSAGHSGGGGAAVVCNTAEVKASSCNSGEVW